MNNYDGIVIGGGLTGSALAYELAKKGLKTLLLEISNHFSNATSYSYGGIAYWCGSDDLTSRLANEGINIHRQLTDELEGDTEFRELDLLFTIDKEQNPEEIVRQYQKFHIQPQLLDLKESLTLEPLLNKNAIVGSLKFPQGHVNPVKTIIAYQQAFVRLGGTIMYEKVTEIIEEKKIIIGVKTRENSYGSEQVIISAGAYSRSLLQQFNLDLPIYFSHGQLIKTEPTDIKLRGLVMPSTTKRLDIEKQVSQMENDSAWENHNDEVKADVLEAGAIQFSDGSFCLGQISQIITNIDSCIDSKISEERIRNAIVKILPRLSSLKGKWYNCQVAFSHGKPFLVSNIPKITGLFIFSGFTSPFVFVPPLAKNFAHYLTTKKNNPLANFELQ